MGDFSLQKRLTAGLVFVFISASLAFLGAFPFQKEPPVNDKVLLVSEMDLSCSFFIHGADHLGMKIIGCENERDKILLSESDVVFINKGRADGLENGQLFAVIELGKKIQHPVTGKNIGLLAIRRGVISVISVDEKNSRARIVKSCSPIKEGNGLLPHEAMPPILGKDQGFDVVPNEADVAAKGYIVYLQNELNMIGSGHWAVIDLGLKQNIQPGQQMTIVRREGKKNLPPRPVGNLVVVSVQEMTSTVKVLSCLDFIEKGDEVWAQSQ